MSLEPHTIGGEEVDRVLASILSEYREVGRREYNAVRHILCLISDYHTIINKLDRLITDKDLINYLLLCVKNDYKSKIESMKSVSLGYLPDGIKTRVLNIIHRRYKQTFRKVNNIVRKNEN